MEMERRRVFQLKNKLEMEREIAFIKKLCIKYFSMCFTSIILFILC